MSVASLLLRYGADPRAQDDAPLLLAISKCDMNMAHLLPDHGADPRTQDRKPLFLATAKKQVDMARLLLDRLSLAENREDDATRPAGVAARECLHMAKAVGHADIVALLQSRGVR